METPSEDDLAGMLTEVGVSIPEADPRATVGASLVGRTERTAATIPAFRPAAPEGERQVTLGRLVRSGKTTAYYEGMQHSMRRPVWVRTVNPDTDDQATAAGRVLSEGWMLGALEHPNIVPVYAAGRDENGTPLILMRETTATPWSEILQTPGHPRGAPEGASSMAFCIERMIPVCRALEHAHARGVIHRDVKPDNILVADDGSIYLHGWSLAVSLDEDPTGRWPLAAEQTQIAGTPAYMAPELARRDAAALGPWTDVYLVGATLHHVLTGTPRHLGENVFDALYSAMQSTPFDYGELIPAELAGVLNRCMAREPHDRFSSMVEVRAALERFLRHLPSLRLARSGDRAATDFRRALEVGADEVTVRDLFWVAHGCYRAALEEWPQNEEAQVAASSIASEMTRYDVSRGNDRPVSDVLDRLETGDPIEERGAPPVRESPTSLPVVDAGRGAFVRGLGTGVVATLMIVALLAFATSLSGCEERRIDPRQAAPLAAPQEISGTFGPSARLPSRDAAPKIVDVSKEIVARLNEVAGQRVEDELDRRAPEERVDVTLGGEARGEGLRVQVRYGGKVGVRHVPPAEHEAEVLTNLDHSIQAAFDDAGVPRK